MVELRAEALAPFKSAAVEAKPLTIFIGPNGSGKSTLLRLLWAFSATPRERPRALAERLERAFGDLERLVRRGAREAKVELRAGGEAARIHISSGEASVAAWPKDARAFEEAGFLTGDAVFFTDEDLKVHVAAPSIDPKRARAVQNANEIAKELLDAIGIRLRKGSIKTWSGLAMDLDELPLPTARALSIALVLAAEGELRAVYIEEPEAHLHPKTQEALALAVARAVNRGKRVAFATHSDYLLYAISDLIAAHGRDPKALGLRGDEALSPDAVAVYLFRREGEEATVERLRVTEDGIDEEELAAVAEEAANRRAKILATRK